MDETSLSTKCGIESLQLLSKFLCSLFGVLDPFSLKVALMKHIFKFGFTPCKAEQTLQGTELQEKEAQKD